MILIITQQLKEKVMSIWAYRCAEGPSSNPCIPKMLESSSTSEELWWEHEKKIQNSPPPKVLSEGAACKTKTPVRAEWLQTFGDVLPTCAPMSHTLATATAKPRSRTECLQVQLSMFTHKFCLPPSPEGNLAFWDQNQGNQRNQTRKTMKYFLFPDNGGVSPKWGWLHFAASLALTWNTWVPGTCQWNPVALGSPLQLLS